MPKRKMTAKIESWIRTKTRQGLLIMFAGCTSLASLDLSSFDTSGASNMNLMFNDCLALRTVTLGEKFAFEGGVAYRQCNLPTPVGNRITGKWVSNLTGVVYDAEDVPTKTAAVYTAEKTAVPFPAAAEGLTYTGEDQTGVAADEYGCYKLYGDVAATDAGTYSVTAVLEDGYKWEDQTTAPREITWTISRAEVAVPAAARGLAYTGKAQTGLTAGAGYSLSGTVVATDAGSYEAVAVLDGNHIWNDGSTDAKTIAWTIGKAKVTAPVAKVGLTYTGAEQIGVAVDSLGLYTIEGGAQTAAGDYTATAKLIDPENHAWADGTTADKQINWSIAKAVVTVPVANTGLTYTGAEQAGVPAGEGYSLFGMPAATDAGTYAALAVLDGNHIWSDGSAAPKTLSWVIGKAVVEAPAANKGLTYTGAEQVGVAAGEGYVLSGAAAATDAGSYTAIATPDGNHMWADGTADAKAIAWSIAKADISTGKAEVEAASFVYMGRAIKPAVTVTVGGKTLTPGVGYMVIYSDNDAIGTAKATVTGMDNYDGALTADFAIVSKVVDVFSDANYGDWYVDFGVLDYAYAHGLVSGYSGTDLVGAYDFITRQDVAVILWRMAGEPEVAGGVDFADVDYGDYYGPAVRWARAAGVINGYQDADGAYRNFGPSDLVTREQLAVMIANYAGKVGGLTIESDCFNLNALPDAASVSDWARTSFGWCVDMGIIGGVQDTVSGVNYAQPGNNAWRISMVSMTAVLHRDVLKLG